MEIAKRTAMDDYLDMYERNLQSAIQRAEAAEARISALEKERDELRAQLEQARKKGAFYHPAFDEGDGSYRP